MKEQFKQIIRHSDDKEQNLKEKQNINENKSDVQINKKHCLKLKSTINQAYKEQVQEQRNQKGRREKRNAEIHQNNKVAVDFIEDNEQLVNQKYYGAEKQKHNSDYIEDNNKNDIKHNPKNNYDIETNEKSLQSKDQNLFYLCNEEDIQQINQKKEDERKHILDDKLRSQNIIDNKIQRDDQDLNKIKNQEENLQSKQQLYQNTYLTDCQEYDAEIDEDENEEENETISIAIPENMPEDEQVKNAEHIVYGSNAIYAIDFKINCQLPASVFLKYTKARAEQYYLNGWIEEFAEGHYEGHFEGSLTNVSKVPKILKKFHNFRTQITGATFGVVHKILELSCKNFEIKNCTDTTF